MLTDSATTEALEHQRHVRRPLRDVLLGNLDWLDDFPTSLGMDVSSISFTIVVGCDPEAQVETSEEVSQTVWLATTEMRWRTVCAVGTTRCARRTRGPSSLRAARQNIGGTAAFFFILLLECGALVSLSVSH